MRGFAASGGGFKGNWHVGVLRHLLLDQKVCFDAYAGVSVGALVGGVVAQYPAGQESEAYQALAEMFTPIETEDIYKRWFPFGRLSAAWKPSLYDSSPLEKLARANFDQERVWAAKKRLLVGAYDLELGKYVVYDSASFEPMVEAILASASYPVAFKPVRVDGRWHTDGGVQCVTPIQALIDLGCDEIDVSICQLLATGGGEFDKDPEMLDVALRSLDALGDAVLMKDVKLAQLYNELIGIGAAVGKRQITLRLYAPQKALGVNSLVFDPKQAIVLQAEGYQRAKDVVGETED
jgi:predicted acylesterase/phospholipase RssA